MGESPVNSLEGAQSADVTTAIQTIDEIDRTVQAKGWAWNREYSFPITPDGDGIIHLPANVLRVDTAYGSDSSFKYERTSQRGLKLYNGKDHTFVFSEGLLLDMILLQEWDDLPEPARGHIAIAAARQMQGRLPSDSTVDRITEQQVLSTLATLEQAQDEVDDTNQISGNATVVNAIFGNGVRRRP